MKEHGGTKYVSIVQFIQTTKHICALCGILWRKFLTPCHVSKKAKRHMVTAREWFNWWPLSHRWGLKETRSVYPVVSKIPVRMTSG